MKNLLAMATAVGLNTFRVIFHSTHFANSSVVKKGSSIKKSNNKKTEKASRF
jgi:hypothetical protein